MEADRHNDRRPPDQPRQGRPDAARERGPVPWSGHAHHKEARPAGRLCHQVQGQLPVEPDARAEAAAAGDSVKRRGQTNRNGSCVFGMVVGASVGLTRNCGIDFAEKGTERAAGRFLADCLQSLLPSDDADDDDDGFGRERRPRRAGWCTRRFRIMRFRFVSALWP